MRKKQQRLIPKMKSMALVLLLQIIETFPFKRNNFARNKSNPEPVKRNAKIEASSFKLQFLKSEREKKRLILTTFDNWQSHKARKGIKRID